MNGKLMIDKTTVRDLYAFGNSTVALLAFLTLVLIASGLILWQDASTRVTEIVTVAQTSPGLNPELLVARRYAAEQRLLAYEASRHDAAFLAANPELLKAAPQAAHPATAGETAFLAGNPELSAARRYAAETGNK